MVEVDIITIMEVDKKLPSSGAAEAVLCFSQKVDVEASSSFIIGIIPVCHCPTSVLFYPKSIIS